MYRKLLSIHFWRRFLSYFSLELNRINTNPLEVLANINVSVFVGFIRKIKMFEIDPLR